MDTKELYRRLGLEAIRNICVGVGFVYFPYWIASCGGVGLDVYLLLHRELV